MKSLNSTISFMKKLCFLLSYLVFYTGTTWATNYYVSSSGGDDNNNGLNLLTPWKTIAKVNASTFNAGDSILFKRGDTWRNETLVPPSSGEIGNHIVFSSYGAGISPKIYGSSALTSYTIEAGYTNVYSGDQEIVINPNDYDSRSYVGSIFYLMNDSVTWGDGITHYQADISSLDENYEWTWLGNKVYFYYDGNINDIEEIECTQIARGINVNEEYITIDGFQIRYCGSRCIGSGIYPERRIDGLHIRNCNLAYTASREEGVGYGVQLFHSNMIIERNVIHSNGRRNISINVVDQTGSCMMRDIIVQDNVLFDGWHTTGVDLSIQGLNHQVKNIVIRRNRIFENPDDAEFKSNFNVMMNFIENNGDEGDIDSVFFYSNIVRNCQRNGLMLNGISNAYVINNTFSGWANNPTGAFAFVYHGMVGNSTVMNNIFYNYTLEYGLYIAMRGATGGESTQVDLNYNLYHSPVDANYLVSEIDQRNFRKSEWDDLHAYGYELDSPEPQDPLLLDTINMWLDPTSPAIGKATTFDFVTHDVYGNPMLSPPNIGAVQYSGIGVTSIEENKLNDEVLLYPNPVSDKLTIKIDNDIKSETFAVRIFNTSGAMVYAKKFSGKQIEIPVNFTSGVYFLKIQGEEKGERVLANYKFVIR